MAARGIRLLGFAEAITRGTDWPEMIIDPVCALVFEAENPEDDIMRRRPRDRDERLFSGRPIARSIAQGGIGFALLAAQRDGNGLAPPVPETVPETVPVTAHAHPPEHSAQNASRLEIYQEPPPPAV